MKKYVVLLIVVCFATSVFAYTEPSLRIKSMGKELAGIVDDQQTDIYLNPARLALIQTSQLYCLIDREGYNYFRSDNHRDMDLLSTHGLRVNTAYLRKFNDNNAMSVTFDINEHTSTSELEKISNDEFLYDQYRYSSYYRDDSYKREENSQYEDINRHIIGRVTYAHQFSTEWSTGFGYTLRIPDYRKKWYKEIMSKTEHFDSNIDSTTIDIDYRIDDKEEESKLTVHQFDMGMVYKTKKMDWDVKLTGQKTSEEHTSYAYLENESYRENSYTTLGTSHRDAENTTDGWSLNLSSRLKLRNEQQNAWIIMGMIGIHKSDSDGDDFAHSINNKICEDTLYCNEYDNEKRMNLEISGENTEYHARFGFGKEISFKKKTTLGMGLVITMDHYDTDLDKIGDSYCRKTIEDSITEKNSQVTGIYDNTTTYYRIALPIGADMSLGKGFYLRAGVTPEYYIHTSEVKETLIPDTFFTEEDSNQETYEMRTDTTLGMGYNYDDTLILDVHITSRLDDYKDWKCSLRYQF